MFMVTCQEAAFAQHFQLRKMAWIVGFLNPEDSWKKSNPLLHNVQMFYIDMIDKGDIYRFIVTYRVISYIFTFVQPPCSWSPPEFYSHLITHGKLVSTHHRMWGWGWDHTCTLDSSHPFQSPPGWHSIFSIPIRMFPKIVVPPNHPF